MRRVVVTGIGLCTALGDGAEATWTALLEGRSGVAAIESFDASSLRSRLGAEIAEPPDEPTISRRMKRMMTRNDVLAMVGAGLAVRDAGIEPDEERTGLFLAGNKETCEPEHLLSAALAARGADGRVDLRRFGPAARSSVHPLFYVEGLQAASLFYVSQAYGLKGANTYFAGTADAGAIAIGRAFRAIRRGEADSAIAGAFDDPVAWWNFSKLDGLGLLSGSNERGAGACRPFDAHRDGTVLGDGAAVLVLEERAAALRRGARVYAELTGFGTTFDAAHLLAPDPSGTPLARAMTTALEEARTAPDAVGYVAAHGSATKLGDVSEARALRRAFGVAADGLAISSVKPATGHLVAAAGALNVAVAALALRDQVAAPTLNLERPDPGCDLDWIPRAARPLRTRNAMAVSRGLEGQGVALLLAAA
jgi:3-oxoacyl-[acyl-carrier-protein] synthase II